MRWRLTLDKRRGSKTLPEAETQAKVGYGDWWSAVALINHSFLNPGGRITEKYCQQIDEMHQKLRNMCPLTLVNMKEPILLHDNVRPDVAQPTPPDHSPTDYQFFKHLDNFLREKCFDYDDDAKNAFNDEFASRWQKCTNSNGFYFD
ncbi:unnamed protein product [Acanthoscelides obtectus]|uniref:Uncharacterized protein n=1 Tax=Acanthoscelides obtectus TaxID=200917 RepID=A0A9P0KNP3_ACAOB|nr:unnamed protein product [Acanthoscelides obtectus]CAK1625692.1 Histone-lysine N-methyltransferase SETMAR [Acanthoscelides obtectus]